MQYASVGTPSDRPSGRNLYHSEHVQTARATEAARVHRRFEQAKNPLDTGVVPRPAYADMFAAPMDVGATAGKPHNNMVPFFGSTMKGLDLTKLERFDIPKKHEVLREDLTPTVTGLTNICGQVQDNSYLTARIAAPMARNNDFPIAAQQTSVRLDAADLATMMPAPKTVDDLRVNQRVVTEGRQASGAKGTEQPVQATFTVDKNRPVTFAHYTEDDLVANAGLAAPTQRPDIELPDVYRGLSDDASAYAGAAGPATNSADRTRPHVILQATQALPTLPMGQAQLRNVAQAPTDDYGKTNVQVYSTERTLTTTKTVQTNLTVAVKAAIAPLLDIFRPTRSEFTLDAARPYGALQAGATIPSKATTYDPVMHAPKTTIKETTIHDTTVANLKGSETGRATNPTAPNTTGRNTLALKEEMRNLRSGTFKVTVYDPKQVAKTTHRQTISCETRPGSVDGTHKRGAYSYVEIDAPATQKQYVSDNEYSANPAAPHQDGYKVVQYTYVPAPTQKQFVSDHEYTGAAGTVDAKAPVSKSMWKWIKNKEAKEQLENGRVPTPSGAKNASGSEAVQHVTLTRNASLEANPRPLGNHRAQETPNTPDILGAATKQKGLLGTSKDDRLDPSLLSAFYENPYTQPLNSVA